MLAASQPMSKTGQDRPIPELPLGLEGLVEPADDGLVVAKSAIAVQLDELFGHQFRRRVVHDLVDDHVGRQELPRLELLQSASRCRPWCR